MGFRQATGTLCEQLVHSSYNLQKYQVIKNQPQKIYVCNLLKQRLLGWDFFPLSLLNSDSQQRHNLTAQENKI